MDSTKHFLDEHLEEIKKQFLEDVDRLVGEWIIHDDILLGVDFDDSISPYKHCSKEQCDDLVSIILRAQKVGATIIIHTAGHINNFGWIREYCANLGIKVASINVNPKEMHFGNWGKPYANWFLDDRAGLVYAKRVLERALEIVEHYKANREKVVNG